MGEATLISEEYRRMQQQLHENPNYGVASVQFAPLVAQVLDAAGANELLDYGAGKGRLGIALKHYIQHPLIIRHYDPAIPAWSAPPEPCGFVACIDVLEHIEPALLDNVLDDLQRVTTDIGVLTVHTGPAAKVLPDGRNAHLIQQPPAWWLPKFRERFELVQFDTVKRGFMVVVERKGGSRPLRTPDVLNKRGRADKPFWLRGLLDRLRRIGASMISPPESHVFADRICRK